MVISTWLKTATTSLRTVADSLATKSASSGNLSRMTSTYMTRSTPIEAKNTCGIKVGWMDRGFLLDWIDPTFLMTLPKVILELFFRIPSRVTILYPTISLLPSPFSWVMLLGSKRLEDEHSILIRNHR